jgi:hypothetical protein
MLAADSADWFPEFGITLSFNHKPPVFKPRALMTVRFHT